MDSSSDHSNIRKAIVLGFFGNMSFGIGAVVTKLAGEHASVAVLVGVNAVILLGYVLALMCWRGHYQYFKSNYTGQQFWRCLLRVAANGLYVWALLHMPLATMIVITFLQPLLVAVFSVAILREPLRRACLASVALGFAGVLVILSVESAPLVPVLVAVASVVITSLNGIFVRTMPLDHPFTFMLYTNAFVAAAFFPFAIPDLPSLPASTWGLLLAGGAVAVFSNYSYFRVALWASVQYTAPLQYTQLIWGVLGGWLVWNHLPSNVFWLGAALIVLGSLLLLPRGAPVSGSAARNTQG